MSGNNNIELIDTKIIEKHVTFETPSVLTKSNTNISSTDNNLSYFKYIPSLSFISSDSTSFIVFILIVIFMLFYNAYYL